MNKARNKRPTYTPEEEAAIRAKDIRGTSVTVLDGKAREYALREFFAEDVPSVRGERVIPQRGLPINLELVK